MARDANGARARDAALAAIAVAAAEEQEGVRHGVEEEREEALDGGGGEGCGWGLFGDEDEDAGVRG